MYADLIETGGFFRFFAKHFGSSIPSQREVNCCEAEGGHDLVRINLGSTFVANIQRTWLKVVIKC